MAGNQGLKILGLVSRWVLAALACWWFFWFIALIGSSSDVAQEVAGMALGKAAICGAVAAVWFYRAREQQAAEFLGPLVHANATPQEAAPQARPIPQQSNQPSEKEPVLSATESSALPEIQKELEPSDSANPQATPSDGKQIAFISIALAVFIFIVVALYRQNGTADVASGGSSDPSSSSAIVDPTQTSVPVGTSLNQFSKSLFEKYPAAPCPAGLNAGAQVALIKDPTILVGSNGAIQAEWQLSFVLSNKSEVSKPEFGGYCITAFEVEAELADANGRVWKMVGEQRLGSSYSYLSPGWNQQFASLDLRPLAKPDGTPTRDAELTNWKVTKAWGFPLGHPDAPKQ